MQNTSKTSSGQSKPTCSDSTYLANTGVVFNSSTSHFGTVLHPTKELYSTSKTNRQKTPNQEPTVGSFHIIRENLKGRGLSEVSIDVIMQSWRKSTCQQYGSYLQKWLLFSNQEENDPFNPSTPLVLKYLSKLYEEGKSYSSINTAKSAISSVCGLLKNRDIGNEVLVKHFMRGIFTRRPNLPRYGAIWDLNTVFNYISSLPSNDELTLLTLSEKLSILLMLLSGQRGQTIHLLKLSDIHVDIDKIVTYFTSLLKHSKPIKHLEPLVLQKYTIDEKLCVVRTVVDYIARTSVIRGEEDRLFISTMPPHQGVTKSTFSRWIKNILTKSGINTDVFHPHSCRAASTFSAIQ